MKIDKHKIKIPFYDVDDLAMLSHVKSYCKNMEYCDTCVFAVFDGDGDVGNCQVSYNITPPENWDIELTDNEI